MQCASSEVRGLEGFDTQLDPPCLPCHSELLETLGKQLECGICLYPMQNPHRLPCNHCFCGLCVERALGAQTRCPICKSAASKRTSRPHEGYRRLVDAFNVLSPASAMEASCQLRPPRFAAAPRVVGSPPASVSCRPPKNDRAAREAVEGERDEHDDGWSGEDDEDEAASAGGSSEESAAPAADGIVRKPFRIGDVVNVDARTKPGENKHGGVGRLTDVHADGTVNVTYVLGGRERFVPMLFVHLDAGAGTGSTEEIPPVRRGAPRQFLADEQANERVQPRRRGPRRQGAEAAAAPATAPRPRRNARVAGVEQLTARPPKRQCKSSSRAAKRAPCAPLGNGASRSGVASCGASAGCGLRGGSAAAAPPLAAIRLLQSSGCSSKVQHKVQQLCMSEFAGGGCTTGGAEQDATHFIVDCDRDEEGRYVSKQRTLKYLRCILRGMWILSKDWIDACLKQKKLVPEADFEVHTDRRGTLKAYAGGPGRARRAMASAAFNPSLRLFCRLKVVLEGQFAASDSNPVPCRADIEELLRLAGATVVAELPSNALESCKRAKSRTWLVIHDDGAAGRSSTPMKKGGAAGLDGADAEAEGHPSGLEVASVKWLLNCIGSFKRHPPIQK